MKTALLALLALAALVVNTPAPAQLASGWSDSGLTAPQVTALGQALGQRNVPDAVQQHWMQQVQDLHAQGVPTDLVGARLLEGLAKNVPAPLINQALTTLSQDLVWAQKLVRAHRRSPGPGGAVPGSGQALAQLEAALRAGLSRADLEQVYGTTRVPVGRIAAIARLAADVVATPVAPSSVVAPLHEMLAQGFTTERINAVDGHFMAALAAGEPGPAAWARLLTSQGPAERNPLSTDLRRSLSAPGGAPFGGAGAEPMGGPGAMGRPGGAGGMPAMPMSPMGH